ncbi:hypothetical protein [Subtercola boreus]|uniref:hypothetical protein n=1 Tax=Subtercola boreus TaxID=120213 RepID=UPI00209C479E|nr:hypothetical protein [Subtercola boreus]
MTYEQPLGADCLHPAADICDDDGNPESPEERDPKGRKGRPALLVSGRLPDKSVSHCELTLLVIGISMIGDASGLLAALNFVPSDVRFR